MKLINGVDIVDIRRIEKILETRKETFIKNIFTDSEIKYIISKNYRANTISGLFAAKEATSKAIGTGIGKVGWKDMEISHNENGKPFINLNPNIKREYYINELSLSISHEKKYAIAFVVGFKSRHSD